MRRVAIRARPEYMPCTLCGSVWDIPNVGRATLTEPCDVAIVAQVDAEWPPQRQPRDGNRHWSWREICLRAPEQFALVGPNGRALALWASLSPRPLSLPGGLSYRLDYIEVAPALRNQHLGLFCVGLVAQRVLEAGCSNLVLEVLPELKPFYTGAGGLQKRAHGWRLSQRLMPFLFERERLTYLKELTDAFLEQS